MEQSGLLAPIQCDGLANFVDYGHFSKIDLGGLQVDAWRDRYCLVAEEYTFTDPVARARLEKDDHRVSRVVDEGRVADLDVIGLVRLEDGDAAER